MDQSIDHMSVEEMLETLFEVQMQLFAEQCDVLFGPMEDIAKAELFFGEDFEAA